MEAKLPVCGVASIMGSDQDDVLEHFCVSSNKA